MKSELEERSALSTANKFFALTTIILAILSLLYLENWLLRIFSEASLFLLILFNGLYTLIDLKRKSLGYFLIGISAFLLAALIFTIYVAFHTGAL
jgi:hypothetical protein